MPYYNDNRYYDTVEHALDAENVDYLKRLVPLLPTPDNLAYAVPACCTS